jgi:hypothetical protein
MVFFVKTNQIFKQNISFFSSTDTLNYFHSNNINTIGDIARSTSNQIETYPIPSPKLANIQKALSLYQQRLINPSSVSPPITDESLIPIACTSEETIRMYFFCLIKSEH